MRETTPGLADFRHEVLEYDANAQVGRWSGPSYALTYRTLGQGVPLILIPGLASTYRGYAPTLNRLAQSFQTIQIDYPGEHDDDGASLGRLDHDAIVDHLLGLVDHLGLIQPALFGLSFGSTITIKALHKAPDTFRKSILQGGFARRRLKPVERLALALGRHFKGKTASLPFHSRGLRRRNRFTFPSGMEDRWAYYVEQNGLTPIAALTHRLDLLDRLDLRPLLPEIGHQMLLIQGSDDQIVPRSNHEELASKLPHARSVMMPGVGHQPHFTHPEAMAERISGFLDEP